MKKSISLSAMLLSVALNLPVVSVAHAHQVTQASDNTPVKVVYHVNDSNLARIAMRNAENHLAAAPNTKIVFVAHGKGIDFLLNNAKDEKGAYAPQVAGLKEHGAEFRVCRNTLSGRNLNDDAVIMEAEVVPSGVAEIAKLEAKEGFVYMKP